MIPLQYVNAKGLVWLFRVADPFGFKRVGVLTSLPFHGQQTHSPIRTRPSAFHYVHMLSTPAPTALGSRQKRFRQIIGRSARSLRLLPGGLRRHARAYP